jgi:hypothetical protein
MLTRKEIKQAIQKEITHKESQLSQDNWGTVKHGTDIGEIRGLQLALEIIAKLEPQFVNCGHEAT